MPLQLIVSLFATREDALLSLGVMLEDNQIEIIDPAGESIEPWRYHEISRTSPGWISEPGYTVSVTDFGVQHVV